MHCTVIIVPAEAEVSDQVVEGSRPSRQIHVAVVFIVLRLPSGILYSDWESPRIFVAHVLSIMLSHARNNIEHGCRICFAETLH